MKSNFKSLNFRDFMKGLLLAVLAAVFTILMNFLNGKTEVLDFVLLAKAAGSASLSYIFYTFFENSEGSLGKPETEIKV